MKTRTPRSVKWAKCPRCNATKLTGLIHNGPTELVFRDHTKKIGNQTVPCPGSGQVWTGPTHNHPL